MGNDLTTSNNDLMKKFSQTIMQDSWLDNLYNSQKSQQQSEIKKIFTVVADNNITASQRKSLESRKEVLEDKVERFEAKMAVLEEEMSENSQKIKEKSNEITSLITSIQNKTIQLEQDHKKKVKEAVDDTFDMYERGQIGKDRISAEIANRIKKIGADSGVIDALIKQLEDKQSDVSSLVDDATKWIEQKNALQNRYGATKSTYELIKKTLNQAGSTETNYTNSDYDTNIPVYSLEKTDIISNITENPKINVLPTNTSYKEGSSKPTLDDLKEKYGEYYSTDAKGELKKGDKSYYLCSTDNKSVTKLQTAIEKGLLNDLSSLGLSGDELKQFFADNFKGTQIKLTKDGTLSIPKGHAAHDGTRNAAKTYDKVADFFSNPTYQGKLNTWDKEAGNTISSNKQIKSLANNYENILDKLGTQEPKFTFKEAMYALFGSDNALFKNSGINYDVSKQGKNPTYTITPAGDSETANMYKNLADKIEKIWGVKPSGVEMSRSNDNSEGETKRTDPLTFNLGDKNQEYAFIVDRDSNNKFDKGEFVGAGSQSWLDDLKTLDKDGDNKLSGDELKALKVLGLNYKDNASTKKDKSNFVREETTNIQYDLTNAAAMGIEEINLDGLDKKVNNSTGKFDANNSEIFSDSFTFKINGKDVTASRKDDTQNFMDAVYGASYNKNFSISLSEDKVQEVMDESYNEFDNFANKYNDVETDLNVLANSAAAVEEVKTIYSNTMDNISDEDNAQLVRAQNRAASFVNNLQGWSNMQKEIAQIASQKGIEIDMEQAKGMYASDASLDAEQIVENYQKMVEEENNANDSSQINNQAWSILVECLKSGVAAKSSDIVNMLKEGKSNDEIVKELKEKNPNSGLEIKTAELKLDDKRTKEIYNAFNKVFNEANKGSEVVDALAQLCELQQKDPDYMKDKSGEDLANELLKKYQK